MLKSKHQFLDAFRSITKEEVFLYVIIYVGSGFIANEIGRSAEIAKFTHWWQVITCYGLYMIPISIVIRPFPPFTQYAYGLVAMGILEFLGYALETSYVYPNNILIQLFGPYTFALTMTLFFAGFFLLGNFTVKKLSFIFFNIKG